MGSAHSFVRRSAHWNGSRLVVVQAETSVEAAEFTRTQILRGRSVRCGSCAADQTRLDRHPVEVHRCSHHRRRSERCGPASRSFRRDPALLAVGARAKLRRARSTRCAADNRLFRDQVKHVGAALRDRPSFAYHTLARKGARGGHGGPPVQIEMGEYLLTIIILLPLAGAIVLLLIGRGDKSNENVVKWTALLFSLATFLVSLALPIGFSKGAGLQFETNVEWIRAFNLGVRYHVAIDGLSLWLVILTTFLVPLALLSSWNSIHKRLREFLVAMLALETGMLGVFVAMDMFLFYLFWEVMLVPMYFLIGVWGGERRIYAAVKFVIYTVVGSLLMLAGIIALYYLHGSATLNFTFDIATITNDVRTHALVLDPETQSWLFWAFALAFLIKVPLFPFHT